MPPILSRYFTTTDCSFWLYQMPQLYNDALTSRLYPDQNLDENTNTWYRDNTDLIISTITMTLSLAFMAFFLARTHVQKQAPGYAHLILGLWILFQVPLGVSLFRFPK